MIYFQTVLCVLIFMALSYLFVKTYQLCGYKPKEFLASALEFKLAYGDKNKLVFTKRMIRFLIVLLIVMFGLFFLANYFITNAYLLIFDIIVIFIFLPLWIVLTHYITLPIELAIKKSYMTKASRKLKKKKLIKIGITGSYGKTSTKNILAAMLEKKYTVCVTPKNFNTEMGLTKTILGVLENQEIFIAEMGARHKGDIETLAKMVKPDYGIINTIGPQHLDTFKNIETIENTKYELAENINISGKMIFNGDSLSTRKLFDRYDGDKYLTCDENAFAYADHITTNKEGSKFSLHIDGKRLEVKTRLLGRCNINNIVTAAALAYLLKITPEEIEEAIEELSPTKHRLELLKNNFCTIIDDAYNSNILGAQEALAVLSSFEGVKIVITPGLVELGSEQSKANFNLGAMIADVADYLIIMNNVNKNELLSGAISHNFDRKHIFFADSRKKQKEILEQLSLKDSVVLFENDLPDNYK